MQNVIITKLDVSPWKRKDGSASGITFDYSSTIGDGRYVIIKDSKGNLIGRSGGMDKFDDKSFIKTLLSALIEKIYVKD